MHEHDRLCPFGSFTSFSRASPAIRLHRCHDCCRASALLISCSQDGGTQSEFQDGKCGDEVGAAYMPPDGTPWGVPDVRVERRVQYMGEGAKFPCAIP